jgi:hypothetical protein
MRWKMELNEELIKRRSKQFDLGCITLLDLSNAGASHRKRPSFFMGL